ncbi:methionine ABC transporter ATP-binding protein [Ligilactobacillus sp.]|uniref:methionine ABC transporter ATP-binding protein n=1 Tax=Ligilactobacillus sp. TaxID=2767921 RepID=UPI002FE37E07
MIEIRNVTKIYKDKEREVKAVDNVSLNIEEGEIFGVIGYSGAGKSTLIRMINGLEVPTTGEVIVDGERIDPTDKKKLQQQRSKIGMIFQGYNLLKTATVLENVTLPLKLEGLEKSLAEQRAEKYLRIVDLWEQKDRYPAELSGGQRQRVAIARALAHEPKILLSDEATSALDPETTESILKLLLKINQELHITIFLITHELDVIQRVCDRVAVLAKGKLIEQGNVLDVFTNPEKEATKKFIGITDTMGVPLEILKPYTTNGQLVVLKFIGQTANEPIIADLSGKYGVSPNILGGGIGYLKKKAYGRLLVHFDFKDEEEFDNAMAGLRTQDIYYERVEI